MKIKIENLFVFFMCKRTHEKYKQVFYFHIDFLHCLFDNEILRAIRDGEGERDHIKCFHFVFALTMD